MDVVRVFQFNDEEETMEIKDKVYEIIARKLKRNASDLNDEMNLKQDLNADSIDTVEVVFEVEEFYQISVPDEYAEKIATIGDAVQVVKDLVKS